MKLIRNAIAVGCVAAAVAVAACSGERAPSVTGTGAGGSNGTTGTTGVNGGQNGTGQVGAHLTLAPGVTFTTFTWTIMGPNSYGPTPVTIGDAESLEFVTGGILAGSGYTLTINGTDSNGDTCLGTSAPFTVTPGGVTQVVLNVVCTVKTDASTPADVGTGNIEVDAGVTLLTQDAAACPGITSLMITPAEVQPGVPVAVSIQTTGPTPVITWSVTPAGNGTFGDPTAASTTFQCSVPNSQETITATIALPDSGLCSGQQFTTVSALFNCESGATICFPGTAICVDGGACIPLNTLTNCGACGVTCGAMQTCDAVGSTHMCVTHVAQPTACTTGPCAATGPNSVLCDQNTSTVCTGTEAFIVNRDIAKGNVSGNLPSAGSCYECLTAHGCINDDTNGDTGHECEDLSGPVGGSSVKTKPQACLDTMGCIYGAAANMVPASTTTCVQQPGKGVQQCFCGNAFPDDATCSMGTVAQANGTCEAIELDGLGFNTSTPNSTILGAFTTTTLGSGQANHVMQCAGSNSAVPSCPQCFN
jgi:hypothetical protein